MIVQRCLLLHLLLLLGALHLTSADVTSYQSNGKHKSFSSLTTSVSNPSSVITRLMYDDKDHVLFRIRAGGLTGTQQSKMTSSKHQLELSSGNNGLLRNVPIQADEWVQFLATSFLMFFFIIMFTMTRDTKDALVVSNCGAEAIPFLKLYGVMPAATIFLVGYSKLSNVLSKTALFYATLLPFFAFYTIFAFVLFPARDAIHFLPSATETASSVAAVTNLVRYWSFSLYFIVTELYAGAGVPLLFWQFANDVTSLEKAKRFYPLFAVIGNLAPIVSGKIMTTVISRQTSNDDIAYGKTLKTLALVKLSVCAAIIALYQFIGKLVKAKTDEMSKQGKKGKAIVAEKNKKKKPTFRESMTELSKSKELQAIATMVVCYNVCVELAEVLWKGILRKTYTNKTEYMSYMGKFSQTVGIVSFVLQLCSPEIIRRMGWKGASLITPWAMGFMATLFFISVSLGTDIVPIKTALLFGTIQNVVCKTTKYTLFDPCKEIAYIPLGPEAKVKGKAAVDVLGARSGRSIGSASQQFMVLVAGGSILNCAPALCIIYLISVTSWSRAVNVLSKIVEKE